MVTWVKTNRNTQYTDAYQEVKEAVRDNMLTTSWHTSCLSSWLSTCRRSKMLVSSPNFMLLCRSSLMYSQAFDKIPPLLWNRNTCRSCKSSSHTKQLMSWWVWRQINTHLPCFGVVHVAVWNGFRKLHNPVVNLVPAPALHCWDICFRNVQTWALRWSAV